MNVIVGKQRTVAAFLLLAVAVYLGNYAIVQWKVSASHTMVPEWPLAIDFFLLLPVAYFLMFRPTAKKALLVFAGIASVGVLVGSFIIPAGQKALWEYLEQGRWVVLIGLLVLQASIVAVAAFEIYRNRHAGNIESAINRALEEKVPRGQVLKLMQADARVWTYALVRDSRRFSVPVGSFSCAKHDANASNQQAFLWLFGAEIPVAHILIHLFSPTWAIVITALSVYGFAFLLADYRATVFRATTLEDGFLHIRHGVLGDLVIPYDQIASVSTESSRPRRSKHALRFVGTGTANVGIHAKPGTILETLLGAREVTTVYVGLDEPGRFIADLRRRLGT